MGETLVALKDLNDNLEDCRKQPYRDLCSFHPKTCKSHSGSHKIKMYVVLKLANSFWQTHADVCECDMHQTVGKLVGKPLATIISNLFLFLPTFSPFYQATVLSLQTELAVDVGTFTATSVMQPRLPHFMESSLFLPREERTTRTSIELCGRLSCENMNLATF